MPLDPFSLSNVRYPIGATDSCGNNFWIPVIQGLLLSVVKRYQWLDDRSNSNGSLVENENANWAPTEPNGDFLEQCVGSSAENGWYDTSCETMKCSVCMIPTAQTFYLRGPDVFEHQYWLSLELHWNRTEILFEGEGMSKLIWYPLQKRTELISNTDSNLTLTFDKTPFGLLKSSKEIKGMSTLPEWIFSNVS